MNIKNYTLDDLTPEQHDMFTENLITSVNAIETIDDETEVIIKIESDWEDIIKKIYYENNVDMEYYIKDFPVYFDICQEFKEIDIEINENNFYYFGAARIDTK